MFGITPSARLRPSPYYEATLAEGVTGTLVAALQRLGMAIHRDVLARNPRPGG